MSFRYDAKFSWKLDAKRATRIKLESLQSQNIIEESPTPTRQDIEGDLFPQLEETSIKKFVEEFAKEERWIKVNSVSSKTTNFSGRYDVPMSILSTLFWTPCNRVYSLSGDTDIDFETDVSPEETHSILAAIAAILSAIAAAMAAHQILTMVVVIIIAWTVSAIAYKLSGTSVWTPITPTNLPEWGAMILIIIVIIILIASGVFGGSALFGGGKKKRK